MENFRSLFLLTKLFGYNIRSFRESETKITSSGTILFLVNVSTFVYFAFQNRSLATGSSYLSTGSQLMDVGGRLMLQTSYIAITVGLIGRAIRQRLMGNILNGFVRVDCRICSELGLIIDYGWELRLAVGFLGMFLILVLVAMGFGLYCLFLLDNFPDGMMFYGGQILVSISGIVLANNTVTIIFLLYRRICLVQKFLRKVLSSNSQPILSNLILVKAKEQIRPAETLHMQISTVASIYDDLYQLSLKQSHLMWTEITSYLGIVITYGTMTLFAAYRALRTGHFESVVVSSMYLVWWVEYCLGALVILLVGHLLELVSRRMVNFLGVSISSDKVNVGLEEIKVRSLMLQISFNPAKITTWFFDVNLRVFFNMLGTMATFLFIMAQFDV